MSMTITEPEHARITEHGHLAAQGQGNDRTRARNWLHKDQKSDSTRKKN